MGHYDILHVARAACQADPPNEFNLDLVNFYGRGLPDSENHVELGCIVSEIQAFQKRYWPAGRQVAHTQFCPLFKNEVRSAPRALLIMIELIDIFKL